MTVGSFNAAWYSALAETLRGDGLVELKDSTGGADGLEGEEAGLARDSVREESGLRPDSASEDCRKGIRLSWVSLPNPFNVPNASSRDGACDGIDASIGPDGDNRARARRFS